MLIIGERNNILQSQLIKKILVACLRWDSKAYMLKLSRRHSRRSGSIVLCIEYCANRTIIH